MRPTPTKLTLSAYRRATMLTRECTGFDSFARLLKAQAVSPGGHRPVLYVQERVWRPRRPLPEGFAQVEADQLRRNRELADLYDLAQQERGDARRAVRL